MIVFCFPGVLKILKELMYFSITDYFYIPCVPKMVTEILSASQVVFEVVTSGHPGYVAIDEVKVLGHPCSKYLSCIVKPDPLK